MGDQPRPRRAAVVRHGAHVTETAAAVMAGIWCGREEGILEPGQAGDPRALYPFRDGPVTDAAAFAPCR